MRRVYRRPVTPASAVTYHHPQSVQGRQRRSLGAVEGGPNKAVLIWSAVSTASMAASAYHGYKRNRTVGWALLWGLSGALFPIITPTIAVAQGFGKRK